MIYADFFFKHLTALKAKQLAVVIPATFYNASCIYDHLTLDRILAFGWLNDVWIDSVVLKLNVKFSEQNSNSRSVAFLDTWFGKQYILPATKDVSDLLNQDGSIRHKLLQVHFIINLFEYLTFPRKFRAVLIMEK
jgi:hypothetical protein